MRRALSRRLVANARIGTGLAWLVFVWVMLWGTFEVGTALAGLAVAVLIAVVLPLPKVDLERRLRPRGLLVLLAGFGFDLVVASVQVAWLAVKPGPPLRSAVLGVRLRTTSDLILTVTTEIVTLIPGSVVIEVSQSEHAVYAHVLGVHTREQAQAFQVKVLALEARIARAIGTDEDLQRIAQASA